MTGAARFAAWSGDLASVLAQARTPEQRAELEAFALAQLDQWRQFLCAAEWDGFAAAWAARRLVALQAAHGRALSLRQGVLRQLAELLQSRPGATLARVFWPEGICEGRLVAAAAHPAPVLEVHRIPGRLFLVASLPGQPFTVDRSREPA